MIVNLKPWQKSLILDLLDALPFSVKGPLEASVRELTYIEKQTGDGFYRDGVAYISRGIRHPRLMLERTCHEWGHGIEEWLAGRGIQIHPFNPEAVADGFALALLYPNLLEKKRWEKIREVYREAFFKDGFPDIGTERLVEKYSRIAKALNARRKETLGSVVHDRLQDFFNTQQNGFLRQKTLP